VCSEPTGNRWLPTKPPDADDTSCSSEENSDNGSINNGRLSIQRAVVSVMNPELLRGSVNRSSGMHR